MKDVDAQIKWLEENNSLLSSDQLNTFDEKKTQLYLQTFTNVFLGLAEQPFTPILFNELCSLNHLYSLQMKLNLELPPYLEEIAYDFDNPDYPGFTYVSQKMDEKKYQIFDS